MFALRCQRCGTTYHADEDKIGLSIVCTTPGCQSLIPVQSALDAEMEARFGSARSLATPIGSARSSATPGRLGLGFRWVLGVISLAALIGYGLQRPTLKPSIPKILPASQQTLPNPAAAFHETGAIVGTMAKPEPVKQQVKVVPPSSPQQQSRSDPPSVGDGTKQLASLPVPIPTTPPPTGTEVVIAGGNKGLGRLTIINGTNDDAVVKLVTLADANEAPKAYRGVYVRAGDTWTMDSIAAGTYRIVFSQGADWDTENHSFQQGCTYSLFAKPMRFQESETITETSAGQSVHTRFSEATITLNPVLDGTARTEHCDKSVFDAVP